MADTPKPMRRYGGPRGALAPLRGGCAPRPGISAVFVGDGRMGLKGKTEQKIHFASSFAITYNDNVLAINALRDAGLQRLGKHA